MIRLQIARWSEMLGRRTATKGSGLEEAAAEGEGVEGASVGAGGAFASDSSLSAHSSPRASPRALSPLSSSHSPDRLPSPTQSPPVHVVRYSDPVDPEPDLLIDTEALHQRYRFFEEFKEPVKEPKRFIMTPPREVPVPRSESPDQQPEPVRDPNVVRSSDVVDDIPRTDTAKKMLGVFKRLESLGDAPSAARPEAKVADVVPVEPEMARSLRAKFENWTTDSETRENNQKNQTNGGSEAPAHEYTPQLDTTRKMLSVFKQLESQTW